MKNKKNNLVFVIYLVLITSIIVLLGNTILISADPLEDKKATEGNNLEIDHIDKNDLINNEDIYYNNPKDVKILITGKDQYFKVVENTLLLDKPNGNIVRELLIDEFLILDSTDGIYGKFTTFNDNLIGYINLGDLELTFEKPISYGVSKVDKAISNHSSYYVLAKGEVVVIKEQNKGRITILDENNQEYIVDETSIDVRVGNTNTVVSRSVLSRRTKSLTKLISSAHRQLGKPYIYGDIGRKGYDCSGLVYSLYLNQLDIKLPRSSDQQVSIGTKIEKSKLAPGDLIFFNTTGRTISHVGLYIGEGKMIHASSGKSVVRIDSILDGYYNDRYVTARRIVN